MVSSDFNLQKFVDSVKYISDIRNLDEYNPVVFHIAHPISSIEYFVIASIKEPSGLIVPTNGIWIVMDATQTYYLRVYRAIDLSTPNGHFVGTWTEVTTYDEIFQYVQTVTPGIQYVGPPGPKGDTGSLGPAGPQGQSGPLGPAGPRGAIGPLGIQGNVGAKGDFGPAGPTGAQGPTGPKGDIGSTGPTGSSGGLGTMGATGPQGIQGPKGDKGDTGSNGTNGINGTVGATGAAGPAGPQGSAGPQGIQGVKGVVNVVISATDPGASIGAFGIWVNPSV